MKLLFVLAVAPSAVLMWYIWKKDTVEKEPFGLLAKLFGFGALTVISAIILELGAEALFGTLLGDGVGSFVGAFFGGCPNTTYGESIGCVAITGNASIVTIWYAAVMCVAISFLSPFIAFLESIPSCVMGGVCIALYGFIAVSGLKMLQNVDLNENRNLFTASVILITGVGGLIVKIGAVEIRTVACALILGIAVNKLLGRKKKA